MKRFAIITRIEDCTPDEDILELGKAYEIVNELVGGAHVYVDAEYIDICFVREAVENA